MISFFTTPKPFLGHIGIIQRNALESWTRIHPQAEVILFGDEQGAAQAARDLGLRHVPQVKRNEHGTKFLSPIFDTAQDLARYPCVCYVNCDILLLSDFRMAVERVMSFGGQFLMAGRRRDTDMNTPPFVIGRPGWDNWLVWHARASGAHVVDATAVVQAVHQNHDYSYHPEGAAGVWQGEEAQRNYALLDGGRCFATLENATHRLTPAGLKPNYHHYAVQSKRRLAAACNAAWFALLGLTRPVRRRLGLRQRRTRAAQAESK